MNPKLILHLENACFFLFTLILFVHFNFSILYFILFLLVPDISMIGYLKNPRFGALIYNLAHNLILPTLLLFLYLWSHTSLLLSIALIWSAHIFIDRTLGFGLKYPDEFKQTHIQKL